MQTNQINKMATVRKKKTVNFPKTEFPYKSQISVCAPTQMKEGKKKKVPKK